MLGGGKGVLISLEGEGPVAFRGPEEDFSLLGRGQDRGPCDEALVRRRLTFFKNVHDHVAFTSPEPDRFPGFHVAETPVGKQRDCPDRGSYEYKSRFDPPDAPGQLHVTGWLSGGGVLRWRKLVGGITLRGILMPVGGGHGAGRTRPAGSGGLVGEQRPLLRNGLVGL